MSILPAPNPAGTPAGPLTAGSLCSGYGGLDLAVMAVTGARLAWVAETDRYAAAVLARHWPGVLNLGDITAVDWATVPPVDLVSAGWPCQDISYAGPGAGITEGTRSGLWLAIADGLRRLRPSYVFLENVAALRTRGLGKVLGDLAALGYDAQWVCLRAADAGAPHRRDRLLLLAVRPGAAARLAAAAGPGHRELQRRACLPWTARRHRQDKPGRNSNGTGTPPPAAIALLTAPLAGDYGADKAAGPVRPSGAKRQTGLPDVIIHRLACRDGQARTAEPAEGRLLPTPDTGCSPNGHGRRGGRPGNGHQSGQRLDAAATALTPAPEAGTSPAAWAEYEPAIRRWEGLLGFPAPPPAEPGPSGRPRLSAAFAEWMMGLAPGFVTGVPGIPRTRQLKIIGNGVVPQQAVLALRLLIDAAAVPAPPGGGIRAAA